MKQVIYDKGIKYKKYEKLPYYGVNFIEQDGSAGIYLEINAKNDEEALKIAKNELSYVNNVILKRWFWQKKAVINTITRIK